MLTHIKIFRFDVCVCVDRFFRVLRHCGHAVWSMDTIQRQTLVHTWKKGTIIEQRQRKGERKRERRMEKINKAVWFSYPAKYLCFFILCRIVKVPVMFRCSAWTKPWMDMGIFIKYIDVTMPVCSKTIHQSTQCPSLSLRFDSVCGYRSYETLKILFVG